MTPTLFAGLATRTSRMWRLAWADARPGRCSACLARSRPSTIPVYLTRRGPV